MLPRESLKQQSALTAEISKSTAHEAVHVHLDQHIAVLSRVDALEAVVSELKQQDASTAETCRSAGQERFEQLVAPHTPKGVNLAAVASALNQQGVRTAETSRSAAVEAAKVHIDDLRSVREVDQHDTVMRRVESLKRSVGPPSGFKQQSALIAEISKSAAHQGMSKAELSQVERLELLAEIEATQSRMAASRAEAETVQRETLEAETELADLNAEALLLEEEQEKATKKAKHKHKKR